MNIADNVGQPDPAEAAELEDLARRAAAGEPVVLDDLLARILPQVRRICGRMLINPDDAEEATQDAMLLVATRIESFGGRSRFSTWLYAVAANSARSTYRKLKRRATERSVEAFPTYADPRTTSVIAGSRLDLLDALETLGESRPELVEPLVLRDIQHLDYREIADLLDVPLGTVKSRIHTARQTVRPLLRVHG
ncbi:RNA polymerase sigma factor [Microlunatus soli]|uniref:RNA polymerase sigma-70 factor, ECF subfamily n=1 Tax=Microlunatus soli TaxID=630515 RepID=A0A1H1T699_9ACTN|nr:sigma-70 family RNA polymerase sigma factor [Microlunatus soli]SDS55159.1 RNA polymerase sigma-70 factor, ECF subfamily [Microlunatus soli]